MGCREVMLVVIFVTRDQVSVVTIFCFRSLLSSVACVGVVDVGKYTKSVGPLYFVRAYCPHWRSRSRPLSSLFVQQSLTCSRPARAPCLV